MVIMDIKPFSFRLVIMHLSDIERLNNLRQKYIDEYNCNFIVHSNGNDPSPPLLWYRLFGAPYKKYDMDKMNTYTIEHIKEVCYFNWRTSYSYMSANALKNDIDAIVYENENRKWKYYKSTMGTVQRTDMHLGGLSINNMTFDEYVTILKSVNLHPETYGYRKRYLNFCERVIEHINYIIQYLKANLCG